MPPTTGLVSALGATDVYDGIYHPIVGHGKRINMSRTAPTQPAVARCRSETQATWAARPVARSVSER